MNTNYCKILFTAVAVCFTSLFTAQNFTWKGGANLNNQQGVYGTAGVSAPANIPGARFKSISWKDGSGNFWLFGGDGYDFNSNPGYLNDLWKYNPTTGLWTWMKGDNIIAQPGVYGTQGVAAAANKPGCRYGATSWTDLSGNLWLMGGYGYDATSSLGYLNDLWKYNPANNQWTWMSGSSSSNANGVYGSMGVPALSNVPSSRVQSVGWADNNGYIWLYGGWGNTASNAYGALSDLWRYNIGSNTWTWMKGNQTIDQNGVYGSIGVSASTNKPGARSYASAWTDPAGNFYLFGGDGFDGQTPASSILNDLWRFSLATNEWTWIKGSNLVTQNGAYGLQGVASSSNSPGARRGGVTWIDAVGNLWLMGGEGLPGTGILVGELNDVWKYNISANEWMWTKGSAVINQPATYGSLNTPAAANRPGGRNGALSWIDANNNLWLFGGSGLASTSTSGKLNDVWTYNNCYISPVTLTITSKDSVICAGESTSLTVIGSDNYTWGHNSSTLTSVVITPAASQNFSVYTIGNNACTYAAAFTQTVLACAGIEKNLSESDFLLFPNPSSGHITVRQSVSIDAAFIVYDVFGRKISEEKLSDSDTAVTLNLMPGIYFYDIVSNGMKIKSGKLLLN